MSKRLPATVQTVRIDPDQLSELARLIGREVAAELRDNPVIRTEGRQLLTPEEAAEFLGKPVGTIRNWRSRGCGPRFVKIGAAVRYRVDALEKFLKDNTRTTDGTR